MDEFLQATPLFDFEHPEVGAWLSRSVRGTSHRPEEAAKDLFYAVRDEINYEVFETDLSPSGISASGTLHAKKGFCLHKSVLYVAACRAIGVPARLDASTVDNHLSTPALEHLVGGPTFLHWFTEIYLQDRWVKVTPVFGKMLCRFYGITPLEFDAHHDSVHQEAGQGKAMRFLSDEDLSPSPDHDEIMALVRHHHPRMVGTADRVPTERSMLLQLANR